MINLQKERCQVNWPRLNWTLVRSAQDHVDLGTWVLSSAIISNLIPSPDSNQVPSSKSKQRSWGIFTGYNVKKSLYGVPLTSHTLSLSTSCILHLSHRVFLSFSFLHSQCLLPSSYSTIYTHTHTQTHAHICVHTCTHTSKHSKLPPWGYLSTLACRINTHVPGMLPTSSLSPSLLPVYLLLRTHFPWKVFLH